jgi:hypothetical protein
VCLRQIGDDMVVFSEQFQRLVALNASAADLWKRLESGADPLPQDASEEIRDATEKTLMAWAEAGLIRLGDKSDLEPALGKPGTVPDSRVFEIGQLCIRL